MRKVNGHIIVEFFGSQPSKVEEIYFTSQKEMFQKFFSLYNSYKKKRLSCWKILRYCVDNSTYRDKHSTNWFFQERIVADRREGNVINEEYIWGLQLMFDQYIFEKGE